MAGDKPVIEKAEAAVEKAEQAVEKPIHKLAEEDADSTDSNVRYAAYSRRIRDVARAGSRYTAYTSDIGEAFRPVVPPGVVTAAYAISWAYSIGDVSFTTYKAKEQGPTPWEAANFSEPTRLGLVATKRSVFQAVASMGSPALTIHTAVKQASKSFANSANASLKRWGPTAVGISIVPASPYSFDHPVEVVTDQSFDKIEHAMAKHPDNIVPAQTATEAALRANNLATLDEKRKV